jgi:energy-coupling factor transporter ATP-binding protein EcfA2
MAPLPSSKRFRIALSFPGEHRDYVRQVAECLAKSLPKREILYDDWNESEFIRFNLNPYLPDLYRTQSELVVVFLCADYAQKPWCGLEWRAVLELIQQGQDDCIMPFRFDHTEIPGFYAGDGYGWLGDGCPPQKVASLILERLALMPSGSPIASKLRTDYLRLMAMEWRDLPLQVLDPGTSDLARAIPKMTLEKVYQRLDTTTIKRRNHRELPLSALKALNQAKNKRMVLLGQPGSGKSTFCRYLALQLAEQGLKVDALVLKKALPGWKAGYLLPVFVPLRWVAVAWAKNGEGKNRLGYASDMTDFIAAQIDGRPSLEGYGTALLEELADKGGVVIFDGLDEVATEYRKRIVEALEDFAAQFSQCYIVATCRAYSYE